MDRVRLLLVGLLVGCFVTSLHAGCDQWFRESELPPKLAAANFSGFATSPNFPNYYPSKIQCVYTFISNPRRRVRLQFEEFILAGSAPKCGDYLDVYSELKDHNLDDLINRQLSGRYCGSVSPRTRISLYQVIVLVFHVRPDSRGQKGFNIRYDFLDEDRYEVFGATTPIANADCGFVLRGTTGQNYSILSPTYPGKYPPNIKCKYLLKGEAGTRIKLSFKDFDLFYGGQHCPYDALTIYDGESDKAPVVTRMCGLQQLIDHFSYGPNLYMEFFTVDPPFAEHRGFHIETTFDSAFVDIEELTRGDPTLQHLSGTECDVRLTSRGESEHIIHSPNFPNPYPPKTTCTYYLDGYQGARSLEKVNLTFLDFSISSQKTECDDAHLAVYLTGQNAKSEYFDNYILLCNSNESQLKGDGEQEEQQQAQRKQQEKEDQEQEEEDLHSKQHIYLHSSSELLSYESYAPRIVLVFKSGDDPVVSSHLDQSHGFLARVRFLTDFGIPGNHSGRSNDCLFFFTSSGSSEPAFFNSPRYPENYPLNITCTYNLIGKPGEVVRIHFEQFELSYGEDKNNKNCNDNVTLYNVFPDGRETNLSHYCWNNYPGPTVSHDKANRVKVVFHSDSYESAMGFRASYEFLPTNPYPPDTKPMDVDNPCGEDIIGKTGGLIKSPHIETKYTKKWICHWNITVRPKYNVLIQPALMKVEGGIEDGIKNCRAAVVRIFDTTLAEPTREWCGEKIFPEMRDYLSSSNTVRISFLTAPDKVNGMTGFNFSWTEVRVKQEDEDEDPPCNGSGLFQCMYTKYCIASHLVCNHVMNCGDGDHSDEMQCPGVEPESKSTTPILTGAGIGVAVLLIIIVICIVSSRRRRRKKEDRRSMIAQRMALNPAGSSISEDYNMYR